MSEKFKTITEVIHYVLFKKVKDDDKYYYVRVFNEKTKKNYWFMGYENHMGLVSSVGGSLPEHLPIQLEKEYQDEIAETVN